MYCVHRFHKNRVILSTQSIVCTWYHGFAPALHPERRLKYFKMKFIKFHMIYAKVIQTIANMNNKRYFIQPVMENRMRNEHKSSLWIVAIGIFVVLSTSACKPNIEKLKSQGDVFGLIEALTYKCEAPGKYYIRNDAKDALVDLVDENHIDILIDILADEKLACAHQNAVELLGDIGNNRAVDPLIDYLVNGDDLGAIEALGKIGDERAIDPIINSLDAENYYTRMVAARVLGDFRNAKAIDPLIVLLNDKKTDVRLAAEDALEKIGDDRWLISALASDDSNISLRAADVLSEKIDTQDIEQFIALLESKNTHTRQHAIELLGAIGDESAVEQLILMLNDEDAGIKTAVFDALVKIGVQGIPSLLNVISIGTTTNTNDVILYKTVLNILVTIGEPMVEAFVGRFGFNIMDLPFVPLNEPILMDTLKELIHSYYSDICKELTPVVLGNETVEAAEYIPRIDGLNRMVLLNWDLTAHNFNEYLSKDLAPKSTKEAEIIIRLGEPIKSETQNTCLWSSGGSTKEFHYLMNVEVFGAQDGKILYDGYIETEPRCNPISGDPVSFDDFWDWWLNQLAENMENE